MRQIILVIVLILLVAVPAFAGQVFDLTWLAPTANTDGSVYDDHKHYNVYCGAVSGIYTQTVPIVNTTTPLVDVACNAGENYFAVTAVDLWNNESNYSNEVMVLKKSDGSYHGPDTIAPQMGNTLSTK